MNYKLTFPDGTLYLEEDQITLEDLRSVLDLAEYSDAKSIRIRTFSTVKEPGTN